MLLAGLTLPGHGGSVRPLERGHAIRNLNPERLATAMPLAVPLAAATLSRTSQDLPLEPPLLEFAYLRLDTGTPPPNVAY